MADGNCGYRVISLCAGMGEDGWPTVRKSLTKEMLSKRELYMRIFQSEERVARVLDSLHVRHMDPNRSSSVDKWMTLPDIGYVVATRYKCVVVSLAPSSLWLHNLSI